MTFDVLKEYGPLYLTYRLDMQTLSGKNTLSCGSIFCKPVRQFHQSRVTD